MKPKKIKTVYACGVAWEWEMGETDVKVYGSPKHLKKEHECTNECGIAKLEIKFKEWVKVPKETKYFKKKLPKI